MTNKKQSEHDKHVSALNYNPHKLVFNRNGNHELSDIIMAGTVNLFEGRQVVAQPDGLMMDKWGNLYVIEYKCSGHKERATQQLMTAYDHILKYQQTRPRLFYVHEDFKVEEIHPR